MRDVTARVGHEPHILTVPRDEREIERTVHAIADPADAQSLREVQEADLRMSRVW